MHRRFLAVAAALLTVIPMAAHAEDSATVETITPTTIAMPVAAPAIDLQAQAKALALIDKRVRTMDVSTRSGEMAMNEDGTKLWQQHADMPLMPASTMKVITAVVALAQYGGSWKPHTNIDFDTRTGTLTLVGGGDPQLTSAQLGTLIDAALETLTAMGAQPSRLTIDDSLFAPPTLQAGVLASQQPSEERPIHALVVDQNRGMDSGIMAGKRMRELLADRGVLIPFKGRAVSKGARIASVAGYRLQSTLQAMLWYSDNDIAEMAFRLSSLAAGRSGTWADARTTAIETLRSLGVDTSDITLVDGAGLSRNNRLTARAIASALHAATLNPRTSQLQSLLPAAGVNGTLRSRYATAPQKCVRGKLHAKTGSLHDVIALAGYAPTTTSTARPFAIIINQVHNSATARNRTRAAVDALAAAFSGC